MEIKPSTISLPVTEASQAGEVRRAVADLAKRGGAGDSVISNVSIIATEAANNIWKHGGGGEILLNLTTQGDATGVEIFALDRGKGIADISKSLEDGYSTLGTSGTGLGAMKRISSYFDIHSVENKGTVVYSLTWIIPPRPSLLTKPLEISGISVAYPGEPVCGDAWQHVARNSHDVFLMADGLGHGLCAAEAAKMGIEVFAARYEQTPSSILEVAHAALRSTRGAAMSVLSVDRQRRVLTYCGVGNIAGCILLGTDRQSNLVSQNGTVGMEVRRFQEFSYPWPADGILVLATDGLGTRWDLGSYPGLLNRHAGVIAGTLYRDFKRGRDDVTVVIAKDAP